MVVRWWRANAKAATRRQRGNAMTDLRSELVHSADLERVHILVVATPAMAALDLLDSIPSYPCLYLCHQNRGAACTEHCAFGQTVMVTGAEAWYP